MRQFCYAWKAEPQQLEVIDQLRLDVVAADPAFLTEAASWWHTERCDAVRPASTRMTRHLAPATAGARPAPKMNTTLIGAKYGDSTSTEAQLSALRYPGLTANFATNVIEQPWSCRSTWDGRSPFIATPTEKLIWWQVLTPPTATAQGSTTTGTTGSPSFDCERFVFKTLAVVIFTQLLIYALAAGVSVANQFPEDLFQAMALFIVDHPQWDQNRLMQPAVVKHYLDGLFRGPKQGPGEPQSLSR